MSSKQRISMFSESDPGRHNNVSKTCYDDCVVGRICFYF